MKRSIFAFSLVAALLTASTPAQPPDAVRALNEQYRARLDEACAPVNQWYLAELMKCYIDSLAQEQASDAAYLADLIHSIAPDTVLPELPKAIPPPPASALPPSTAAEPQPTTPEAPAPTPPPAPLPTPAPEPTEKPAPAPEPKLTELDRVKIILPDVAVMPALMNYEFPAANALLQGDVQFDGRDISLWRGCESSVSWSFTNTRAGRYDISLLYSTDIAEPGAFELRIGNESLTCPTIPRTGARYKYRKRSIGTLYIPTGETTIALTKKQRGGLLFNLQQLQLDEVPPAPSK